MTIKDTFGRFIDIDVSQDMEVQAWQSGTMKYGFMDLSGTNIDSNFATNNSAENIFSENSKNY